jgi:hypothetical protein
MKPELAGQQSDIYTYYYVFKRYISVLFKQFTFSPYLPFPETTTNKEFKNERKNSLVLNY